MSETAEAIPVPDLGTPAPEGELPPVIEPDAIIPEYPRPRSRRRKPQPPPPEPAPHVANAEEKQAIAKALGMGWRILFQLVASKRGEHWALQEQDEEALGNVWADALEPYLATSAKYMPIAIATLVTTGIVVPRVQRDAELVGGPTVPQPLEVMP